MELVKLVELDIRFGSGLSMVFGFLWPGAHIIKWASRAVWAASGAVVTSEEDEGVMSDISIFGFDNRFEYFVGLFGCVGVD